MALLKRHLISGTRFARIPAAVIAALALSGFAPAAPAQSEPRPPATFRTLALGPNVSGLFYDAFGKPVPVAAGASGFSAPHRVPKDGRLEFYRQLPPSAPEGKPRRDAVATLQLREGGPWLVFMAADPRQAAKVNTLVVDHSWDAQPVRTMKVFNFSNRRALVKVGEDVAEIAPAQARLFACPEGNQVRLQVATREATGWVLRVGGPQLIPPRTRSSVILLDQQPSEDRPVTDALLVRNLIDNEPPAPARMALN